MFNFKKNKMMKSILFSVCLVTLASTTVMAQTSTTNNATTQVEPRNAFASKVNEFEAAASRDRVDLLMPLYSDIAAMMSKQMSQVHQDYTAAAEPKKETLKKKLDLLQTLYADTKMMTADLAKNKKDMVAKMKQFQANF